MSVPIDIPAVNEATLVLVINQAYVSGGSKIQTYEATRGHWRVGPETRATVTLVLGVADGIVRGVYRPSRWYPSPNSGEEGRWGFDGADAQELVHLVGTSVGRLPVKRGASNPVRLYLGGIPEAGAEDWAPGARWEVEPGDYLGRKERQGIYGGAIYGGIEPSAVSPNVFLYSDPSKGKNYGYNFDGWNADNSVFFYTGEGKIGDQRLADGNASILRHAVAGRALRLFIADGVEPGGRTARQKCIGQFNLDLEIPYEIQEARDEAGELRSVFVFRLRPVGAPLVSDEERSAAPIVESAEVVPVDLDEDDFKARSVEVAIEAFESFESVVEVVARMRVAIRREAALVSRLNDSLSAQGHQVFRQQIHPAGQANPLFTDLFDSTDNILYEAKSDSTRESIRMAIGQLFDYRRFLPAGTRFAVLVPTEPARDLVDLLRSVDFGLCFPDVSGSFHSLR